MTEEELGEMDIEHDPFVNRLAKQLPDIIEEIEAILVHLTAVGGVKAIALFGDTEQIELRVKYLFYSFFQEL